MEKIAFLFSGQGSQFVGMSKTLCENYRVAKMTFQEADSVLGMSLSKLCFEGRLAELTKTVNTQPAILTASVAAFRVYMQEVGILPAFCAGHSLGEYSALACAGVLSFEDMLKLVRKRGEITQKVVNSDVGAMTIIDGMDAGVVAQEAKKISNDKEFVSISCFNSKTQTAVSGHESAVMKLEDKILELGGQTTPLLGSAPFHSILMSEAAEELKTELDKLKFMAMRYPVISNVTAKPYKSNQSIPDMLKKQMMMPVRWRETISYLESKGVTMAIEISPKNVLCNLTKENSPKISAYCYGQAEDMSYIHGIVKDNHFYSKDITNVVSSCLKAALSTPCLVDGNKSVIDVNYKKLLEINESINSEGRKPCVEESKESLDLLKGIFEGKGLPLDLRLQWINSIIDESGSNYSDYGFSGR